MTKKSADIAVAVAPSVSHDEEKLKQMMKVYTTSSRQRDRLLGDAARVTRSTHQVHGDTTTTTRRWTKKGSPRAPLVSSSSSRPNQVHGDDGNETTTTTTTSRLTKKGSPRAPSSSLSRPQDVPSAVTTVHRTSAWSATAAAVPRPSALQPSNSAPQVYSSRVEGIAGPPAPAHVHVSQVTGTHTATAVSPTSSHSSVDPAHSSSLSGPTGESDRTDVEPVHHNENGARSRVLATSPVHSTLRPAQSASKVQVQVPRTHGESVTGLPASGHMPLVPQLESPSAVAAAVASAAHRSERAVTEVQSDDTAAGRAPTPSETAPLPGPRADLSVKFDASQSRDVHLRSSPDLLVSAPVSQHILHHFLEYCTSLGLAHTTPGPPRAAAFAVDAPAHIIRVIDSTRMPPHTVILSLNAINVPTATATARFLGGATGPSAAGTLGFDGRDVVVDAIVTCLIMSVAANMMHADRVAHTAHPMYVPAFSDADPEIPPSVINVARFLLSTFW